MKRDLLCDPDEKSLQPLNILGLPLQESVLGSKLQFCYVFIQEGLYSETGMFSDRYVCRP